MLLERNLYKLCSKRICLLRSLVFFLNSKRTSNDYSKIQQRYVTFQNWFPSNSKHKKCRDPCFPPNCCLATGSLSWYAGYEILSAKDGDALVVNSATSPVSCFLLAWNTLCGETLATRLPPTTNLKTDITNFDRVIALGAIL